MKIHLLSLFILFLAAAAIPTTRVIGQVPGCTDPAAINYDPGATINDGSCLYRDTTLAIDRSHLLDMQLNETSGLIHWRELLWTHNDDTDTRLYGLDDEGNIRDSIRIAERGNRDWEDLAQDDQYIYIGDVGNNGSGTRDDLHFLRIPKQDLLSGKIMVDTIWFSYSLQDSTSPAGPNRTDFDCEAFLVRNDSMILFTKEWISQRTTVYALPAIPGRHIAQAVDTVDVGGMVTGATAIPDKGIVVLCGYTRSFGQPFLYLLYDHPPGRYSRGNQRKVYLDLYFHQVEAIAHAGEWRFFLTNERSGLPPIAISPAALHEIDLEGLLEKTPTGNGVIIPEMEPEQIRLYPIPFMNKIHLDGSASMIGTPYWVAGLSGQIICHGIIENNPMVIDTDDWPTGYYLFYSEETPIRCIKVSE